jgi:hypothetical protein
MSWRPNLVFTSSFVSSEIPIGYGSCRYTYDTQVACFCFIKPLCGVQIRHHVVCHGFSFQEEEKHGKAQENQVV